MFTGSKNHFTPHKIQQTPLPLTPMTAIAFQEAAEFGLDHKATLGFKKFMNTTRGPGSNFFSQHRDSFSPMGVATPIFTLFFLFAFSLAADTLIRGQGIAGIETLISAAQTVELGFFTPGNSQNRYLGIWFKKVSVQTVVWVANRQNPITTSSAVLKIANDGNLVVLDGRNTTLWSTNSSLPANSKSTAKLLDSGNLVLMADGISGETLWQSFDYPSDTLLSGMKVGINLKTGVKLSLTSWKTTDDPSPGNFTYEVDVKEWPEFFVLKNEINKIWRSGPWNGLRFSGMTEMDYTFTNNYIFTNNKDEIYFSYFVYNASIITRMTLDASGLLQRFTWIEGKHRWVTFWSAPRDQCESYAACGPFSSCNSENSTYCDCLHGFEPKFSHDWYLRDWSGGCVRRTKLNCGNGDGFLRLINMELPDTSLVKVDESLNLEECRPKCLNNCSCTAYATSDINGTGSGCAIWIGDLKDLRAFSNGGQEFYLRLHSSELDIGGNTQLKGSFHKKRTLIMALATFIPGTLLLVGCGCYLFKKKKKIKVSKAFSLVNKLGKDEGSRNNLDLPLFDFSIIEAATENFSTTNKLGHGGFGSVYKGKLLTGQDIAVKRLSKSSGQGIDEFENEVMLIVKLQHRNLVRLLGFCIHEEEKILVYEYMPNKSLDFFLFDQTKSALLDWKKRFHIIVGVARGLLYLHEDSRLRIIHRDLKPSNILLDAEMNPKISDFGMARIFGGNQAEANTMKVVGTYGYMSPEYAMNGIFSVKSDVFSFGVVVLEIVSGKKSNNFYHFDESLSLIGYGWKLWKEGRSLELMDPSIGNSCQTSEVLKCIHIGLLCVQESARDRPNMSSVVFMLGSEMATLPPPKKPSFPTGLTTKSYTSSTTSNPSINNVTNTIVEPR